MCAVLLKVLLGVVLKIRTGGRSIRWAEFCAMHLLFTYMKEEMARDRDLNQFAMISVWKKHHWKTDEDLGQ